MELYLCLILNTRQSDLVKELMSNDDAMDITEVMQMAAIHGHTNVLEISNQIGADLHSDHDRLLVLAVENGHKDTAKFLFEQKCDFLAHEQQEDAFNLAAARGHVDVVSYICDVCPELLYYTDEHLRGASRNNHYEIVNILLKHMEQSPCWYWMSTLVPTYIAIPNSV